MKRLLLLVPILALLLLPLGCGGLEEGIINSMVSDMMQKIQGEFTIEVGGTEGLNFTGEYEVWFFHYDPDTQSVVYTKDSYTMEGQVPAVYTCEGNTVALMFQKRTDDYGELSVEIWKDQVWLRQSEDTDPWGVVFMIEAGY